MRFSTLALICAASVSLSACAAEEVVGANARFTVTLPFSPDQLQFEEIFDPTQQQEVADIAGQITCGALVAGSSTLQLSDFSGGMDGGSYNLTATLIDMSSGEELNYFEWSGTFSADAKAVSLASSAAGLENAATDRLKEILGQRTDKSFKVRFTLSADNIPTQAVFVVVQDLQVATANGTCP